MSENKRGELPEFEFSKWKWKIKTYPDLNFAALKGKKAKELRLWYLLRSLDFTGRGWVEKSFAYVFIGSAGIMSFESFRRTLKEGEGLFWEIKTYKRAEPDGRGGNGIELRSLVKLSHALGVEKHRRSPVWLPWAVFETMCSVH